MNPSAAYSAAEDVAAALVSQPALFPLPADSSRASAPVPIRGTYTGELVTRDESRVIACAGLRMLGCSDREIARRLGCARESIPLMLAEAERRQLIRPLKERLSVEVGLLAEDAALAARELVGDLREGDRSEGVTMGLRALGPVLGIAAEKHLLLTGQATEIVEQRGAPARAEVEAWFRSIRDVTPAPTDSASAGQALPSNGLHVLDTQQETPGPAQAGELDRVPAERRGGGRVRRGGATETLVQPGSKISTHGANASGSVDGDGGSQTDQPTPPATP